MSLFIKKLLNPSNLNHSSQTGNQQGTQSLNSTVVNEVHAISYDRRRRPSSAQLPLSRQLVHGHIPTRGANSTGNQGGIGIHKPLPGISEPNKNKNQNKKARAEKAKASPWRFVLKCLLISLFLSIPVVIFILMMALSGGFSTMENVELSNGTTNSNITTTTVISRPASSV
uniref:Uncharacterized protein n=1 Tax=Ditylenchus dipsaci TaxID=166011 RepID=A0A915DU52_9BILA